MQREGAGGAPANSVDVLLLTACLLAVLAIYAGLRVLHRVVLLLELDPWEVLVYLGLAEHRLPGPSRRARDRSRVRTAQARRTAPAAARA